MKRRPLWETLVELLDAVTAEGGTPAGLRVTGLYLDVPLEVSLGRTGAGLELLGDLPRWRWTTEFDNRQGRLQVECRESEPPRDEGPEGETWQQGEREGGQT